MPRLKAVLLLSLATLCAPAFGQGANPAVPGTLNYVEGQVSMEGEALSQRSVGQASLEPGQILSTGAGKAEMLLTPGIFLRLDGNSEVRMISPSLTNTVVALDRGRAEIEVDELHKQNRIVVDQKGGQTQLLKGGLYEFNANANTMRVFDGKAAVVEGSTQAGAPLAGKVVEVKGDRELELTGEATRPTSFNKSEA
ncbi:MAG TPA: FecR domain-containing protein, partial [Acidobacteriaceae bacterium]